MLSALGLLVTHQNGDQANGCPLQTIVRPPHTIGCGVGEHTSHVVTRADAALDATVDSRSLSALNSTSRPS